MEKRERLGSRLGFIMLSAGCAIGCGNIWKFPWMVGQNGGGAFVLLYLVCLLVLGLPVLVMELSIGRAAQTSPLTMLKRLEKPGKRWHVHGPAALIGNTALMCFYTVVTGWIICYFIKFLTGDFQSLSYAGMTADAPANIGYMLLTVALGFGILCFNLQGGLERVSKIMMTGLLILILVLTVRAFTLEKAKEGLAFYLLPDFGKLDMKVFAAAMNQAFFTLGLGVGSMAVFGSYIGKERSLMGESVRIICLDTFVAVGAGLIIFPACFTYNDGNAGAGPALLFDTMVSVFSNMEGGRIWGTVFFLFMTFAAMSTVLAVFESILSMVRDMTGWSRPRGCLVCGAGMALLASTTALGYSVIPFHPFGENSVFLDFWDFIVTSNLVPLGALVYTFFCCTRIGWGWDGFLTEANAGTGMKIRKWMKPVFKYLVPALIAFLYVYGLITYSWG
ncbi:MAG: sodium-dependent transporter [Clostridiales bacterium]|nr:sodium-dependent transporter [Clostridiales bacterium]